MPTEVNLYEHLIPKRWWFVFRESDMWDWWRVFCHHRPGFSHCFAFARLADNIVLLLNPQPGRVEQYVLTISASALVNDYLEAGHIVLVAKFDQTAYRLIPRGPLTTCASFLAYTVGLPFWGATPWQLYRALLRNGAKELTSWAKPSPN